MRNPDSLTQCGVSLRNNPNRKNAQSAGEWSMTVSSRSKLSASSAAMCGKCRCCPAHIDSVTGEQLTLCLWCEDGVSCPNAKRVKNSSAEPTSTAPAVGPITRPAGKTLAGRSRASTPNIAPQKTAFERVASRPVRSDMAADGENPRHGSGTAKQNAVTAGKDRHKSQVSCGGVEGHGARSGESAVAGTPSIEHSVAAVSGYQAPPAGKFNPPPPTIKRNPRKPRATQPIWNTKSLAEVDTAKPKSYAERREEIETRVCSDCGGEFQVKRRSIVKTCRTCREKRFAQKIRANHPSRKYVFTPEMDERLRQVYLQRGRGGRFSIKATLGAEFGFPAHVITKHAVDLGISRTKEKPWSEVELDLLERHSFKTNTVISRIFREAGFSRSATAINNMVKRHVGGRRAQCPYYSKSKLGRRNAARLEFTPKESQ